MVMSLPCGETRNRESKPNAGERKHWDAPDCPREETKGRLKTIVDSCFQSVDMDPKVPLPRCDCFAVMNSRQKGSETVEFTLVLLTLMAAISVLFDAGWAIFAKSTLQRAVRVGVTSGTL